MYEFCMKILLVTKNRYKRHRDFTLRNNTPIGKGFDETEGEQNSIFVYTQQPSHDTDDSAISDTKAALK